MSPLSTDHAYKMLSSYLLLRMLKDIEGFLTETQAGFRKDRSTRDKIFILATLIDKVLTTQERCTICFIDFVAAFDTVSHHFLDEALGYTTEHAMMEPECAEKCRAIFSAIYAKATGCVRVTASDGEKIHSEHFPIRRGVVQGDIFSPLCFIISLCVLL